MSVVFFVLQKLQSSPYEALLGSGRGCMPSVWNLNLFMLQFWKVLTSLSEFQQRHVIRRHFIDPYLLNGSYIAAAILLSPKNRLGKPTWSPWRYVKFRQAALMATCNFRVSFGYVTRQTEWARRERLGTRLTERYNFNERKNERLSKHTRQRPKEGTNDLTRERTIEQQRASERTSELSGRTNQQPTNQSTST